MGSSIIAIICDGKEISYGLNLFHLFRYKNEKDMFISGKYDELSIEMYSLAAFRHANISKTTTRIYVGAAKSVDSSYKKVFNKFGMTIYQKNNEYVLKADVKQMGSYNEFISYANEKRNEYMEFEKDYFMKVDSVDANWIVGKFIQSHSAGVFRKSNAMIQQLYDCVAFVVYLDFLKNTKE